MPANMLGGHSHDALVNPKPFMAADFMDAFNVLQAWTRTVLDACVALTACGSFVKGFTPLRAGVAGVFFYFMFSMPANLNAPCFFDCPDATPMVPSTTPFTCFGFKPTVSPGALHGGGLHGRFQLLDRRHAQSWMQAWP